LAIEHREAVGTPRGVVLCGHAMMCNRRTLDRPRGEGLATRLAEAGFETYLLDLRGHGESGGNSLEAASVRYDDLVFHDLPAAIRAVASRHPLLPLAVLGHSLTAHAALATLGVVSGLPVRALVSLGGNVWMRSAEPSLPRWVAKRAFMAAWRGIAEVAGSFPTRRLRMGTDDEPLPYCRQLAGFVERSEWRSADGAHDYHAALARITVPILSVTGTADLWYCHPRSARLFLSPARSAKITHHEVPGVTHMGLVVDPHMRPHFDRIAAWLGETMA
jgi:predicted alpha/beta hydrolase